MAAQKKPAHLKKRMISVRLPEWIIQWMDAQPETNRAVLIEDALKKAHAIDSEPNAELTGRDDDDN